MNTLILSLTATICVTTIAVVFIYCLFRHLDTTGFAFQKKVAKDIRNLQESEEKTTNTFFKIEEEMMAMKERIDSIEKDLSTISECYIQNKIFDHEQKE